VITHTWSNSSALGTVHSVVVNPLVTQDSVSDWNSDRVVGEPLIYGFHTSCDCQRRVRFLSALVRKQGVDMQGYQPALLATTAVEHSLRACASTPSRQHNRVKELRAARCPFSVSLKGVLLRSLVGGSGGLCDVANVVLEELPITCAFHPHVRAAVCRLPVDTTAVRHDR
jgi:hypothetical protein